MKKMQKKGRRMKMLPCLLGLLLSLQLSAAALLGEYEYDVVKGLISAFYSGNVEEKYVPPMVQPKEIDVQKILGAISVIVPHKIEMYRTVMGNNTSYSIKYREEMTKAALEDSAKMAAEALVTPGMTDTDKVRAFHDFLILNTVYTYPEKFTAGENSDAVYSAAGPLVYKQSVCDGYTRAMMLMCKSQNIPAIYIGANNMNHSWNAIYLEGQWWQVDVTWDDDDINNRVRTDYLLAKDSLPEHSFDSGALETLDYADHLKIANWYYFERSVPKPEEPKVENVNQKLDKISGMSQMDLAGKLRLLGKFQGTDLGYELERVPKRVEAATMFSRMNGWDLYIKGRTEEFKALCPFNDVPEWAAPTLGVLFNEKLIAGISSAEFGSENATGPRDYATMLLRSMKYQEGVDFTWETSLDKAREIGLIRPDAYLDVNAPFTRGDMVEMTSRALFVKMGDSNDAFGDHISLRGIISKEYQDIMGVK